MMQVIKFDCIESTHLYLAEALRNETLRAPVMVVAERQSGGIGSRGNSWENVSSGLYFSFALPLEMLPEDLPLESLSIYMGYLIKEVLKQHKSHVWLKWPNDLYVGQKKIGGIISTKLTSCILVGIGINLKVRDSKFGSLDVEIPKDTILSDFMALLKKAKKNFTWKLIFSKYALEFGNNFGCDFHYGGRIITLRDAKLCEDGAILLNGEKIYSLR